jgi:hypothetical protein
MRHYTECSPKEQQIFPACLKVNTVLQNHVTELHLWIIEFLTADFMPLTEISEVKFRAFREDIIASDLFDDCRIVPMTRSCTVYYQITVKKKSCYFCK